MAAKSGMARFGTCTITNNKRLMNMSISDKELTDAAAHSTCRVVPNNDGVNYEVEWEGNTTLRTPDQVHTLLYRKLHGTFEVNLFFLYNHKCRFPQYLLYCCLQKLLPALFTLVRPLSLLSSLSLSTSALPVAKK